MTFSPHPARGDGAVASGRAPGESGPGSAPGLGSPSFSGRDVLNGERTGMQGRVVATPSATTRLTTQGAC